MTRFDDDDKILLELRDCDAHNGYSVSGLGTYYERNCPECGFPRLREVFTSNGKERGRRKRIQCPNCGARTFDVSIDFGTADAFMQFRRGWFWPVDDEGYPVFGNGQRVTPSAF